MGLSFSQLARSRDDKELAGFGFAFFLSEIRLRQCYDWTL